MSRSNYCPGSNETIRCAAREFVATETNRRQDFGATRRGLEVGRLTNTTEDEDSPSAFSVEVGRRLRAVRRARKLSLDEVERSSGGRWSASAVGAYERGFRHLSLPRLRELAEFYDVPMAILLGEGETAEGARAERAAKVVL